MQDQNRKICTWSLIAVGLFLDDAGRDVRAVLGYLPRGAQPPAQVGGEASQDGVAGNGRGRDE